jgi:uncharacterized lipoprotein YajG
LYRIKQMKRVMLALLLLAGCYNEPKTIENAIDLDVHACHYFNRYNTTSMRVCFHVINACAENATKDGHTDLENYRSCMVRMGYPR